MLLFTMQALGELAVMYPVNGAFYTYVVRFIDPSWFVLLLLSQRVSWLHACKPNNFLRIGVSPLVGNMPSIGSLFYLSNSLLLAVPSSFGEPTSTQLYGFLYSWSFSL